MNKIFVFAIMFITAANISFAEEINNAEPQEQPQILIRDGFAFPNNGVEGKITKVRNEDKWIFSPYTDISDGRGTIKAGESIELLPASTLEKLIALINSEDGKSTSTEIKLWGKITRYNNMYSSKKFFYDENTPAEYIFSRNYLFATNFIPITSIKQPRPETTPIEPTTEPADDKSIIPETARDLFKDQQAPVEKTEQEDDDSKSNSIIPKEVMEKFKLKRVENLSKWKQGIGVESDAMLSNRTGFITKQNGNKIFTLDALGRNAKGDSFILLPCETLERTERKLVTDPGRQRYKISGTITRFKDRYYILPQRSLKAYDHGNFAR